jgi:hypothetical protein
MRAKPHEEQDTACLAQWSSDRGELYKQLVAMETLPQMAFGVLATHAGVETDVGRGISELVKSQCSYCRCIIVNEDKHHRKCSKCLKARYCSEKCQLADWTAGHRLHCRA